MTPSLRAYVPSQPIPASVSPRLFSHKLHSQSLSIPAKPSGKNGRVFHVLVPRLSDTELASTPYRRLNVGLSLPEPEDLGPAPFPDFM